MERLRQMLRRKAGQVAPEPEGKNIRLSEEESGPAGPTGGEEAGGQHKQRSCLACCRKWMTPAPLADPEAPSGPKWRWPRVQLRRREPGEGRSRARQLWGFLHRKPRSQELHPRAQQEPPTTLATVEPPASPTLAPEEPCASPTLVPEEPPASQEEELSDSGTNTSSSSYSQGGSSSSAWSDRRVDECSLFAGAGTDPCEPH
ncbi:uncharacterized protein LOC117882587 [Trachemys scripta elegans]|uniref:uncharacterized protein LOC117882587 n=1 Tax=Trachemys scripta elegans TaxID=31138 RepID=UPI001553E24B|nr:uncharacterized protein LOC117882587 [Trachemys scripta elegans]